MEKKMIVAIKVENIQDYIYQRIDEQKADIQNDDKTLREIIESSEKVSKEISDTVLERFPNRGIILNISGKIILKIKAENEDIVKKKLKELFQEIYIKYKGKIFLNYVSFEENVIGDMDIIKETNRKWKYNGNYNEIIRENSELLFNFLEKKNTDKEETKEEIKSQKNDIFLKDMDDLISEVKKRDSDSSRGKIAIVKADINNLGAIFKKIDDYEAYINLSNTLKELVDFKEIENLISDDFKDLKNKILPIYMAGDDIFYGVKIDSVLKSIELLAKLVEKINDKIESSGINKKEKLSISVGVTFVDSHLPIRYYREEVEKELSNAKKNTKIKNEDKLVALLGVSISQIMFYKYYKGKGQGKTDGFPRFVEEINQLIHIKDGGYTNSYLHKMLEILEGEKAYRQMQLFLYYAKPNTLAISNEKDLNEYYFKNYLFEQIYKDRKNKKERVELDSSKINEILIPKLKIIILLTDEKYYLEEKVSFEKNKYILKNSKRDKFKNRLSNLQLNYIYGLYDKDSEDKEKNYNSKKTKDFFDLFIEKMGNRQEYLEKLKEKGEEIDEKELAKVKKNKHIEMGYKKAEFNSSFFYRVKNNLNREDSYTNLKVLFKNYNENILNKRNCNNEFVLDFNIDEFNKYIEELKVGGTEEFNIKLLGSIIDDLILFYEYDNLKIKFKDNYEG